MPGFTSRWNRVGRMDGHEAPARASEDGEGDVKVGRSAGVHEPLLQRGALDELQDEEGHLVVLAERVDIQHVRMIHPRHRARLLAEAFAHVDVKEVWRNELDRDVPIEALVVSEEDNAHRAATELPRTLYTPPISEPGAGEGEGSASSEGIHARAPSLPR